MSGLDLDKVILPRSKSNDKALSASRRRVPSAERDHPAIDSAQKKSILFSPLCAINVAVTRLANKSLVVIGGSSGLGFSAAMAFVQQGARVVILGRNADKVAAAEKQLGAAAIGVVADAMQPSSAAAAIQTALLKFGGFHGLYHVAGGSGRREGDGPLHEITDQGWAYTLNENLTALFYSNRAAAQQFLKQGSGGTVLNMGSVLAQSPSPRYFSTHAYTAAKSAILGFTQATAAYYAPTNIRFNVIAPALVATPMSERAQGNEEIRRFITTKQPLEGGRIGLPSDLDGAAVFFMSDESKYVTGQVLSVDGGWSVSEGQVNLPVEGAAAPRSAGAAAGSLFSTLGRMWGRFQKNKET
jgi:NAD(P)-dependent dehydrogenase (short-subunit alcohol dehydrogenase family)